MQAVVGTAAEVEQRPQQEVASVGAEHEVVAELPRGRPRPRRAWAATLALRSRLVVEVATEREEVLERLVGDAVGRERTVDVVLGEDPGAHRGIAQRVHARLEREIGDGLVARSVTEGLETRLVAEQHAEAPAGDLGVDVGTACVRGPNPIEPPAPHVDVGTVLEDQERHGSAVPLAVANHPVELGLHRARRVETGGARRTRGHQLQDAALLLGHHLEQRRDLGGGGEGARHRLAVQIGVAGGATGGEPERAGAQRQRAGWCAWRRGRRGSRRRGGAPPSRTPAPPRAAAASRCRCARGMPSSASRYSGNDSQSHWMPSASAVPGMSSTPSISSISHCSRPGRTGANPTPQLPSTTVVTPCQHDGVRCGSQVA